MKLDLVGLISSLGTKAATKSLAFSAMNDAFSITGHIGPGSLSVATALIQVTGITMAQLFTFGEAGDEFSALQMDCPDGLRYIGLFSSTESPVHNTVGASIVGEHERLWTGELPAKIGRDSGRLVQVIILEARSREGIGAQVKLKATRLDTLFLGWLPLLLTFGVASYAYLLNEWIAAGLITLGTLAMFAAVLGLQHFIVFKHAKPQVAPGSPLGDCLVVDARDSNILHIIKGDEEIVQALFQRKLEHEGKVGKSLLLLAGFMLIGYCFASILGMPNISLHGQILYSAANMVGFVTDIVKATKNGRLGLARKAIDQFDIVLKERLVFGNRTAAVAFVAGHAENPIMLKSKDLLPSEGPVWEKWWKVLSKSSQGFFQDEFSPELSPNDQTLLTKLITDMRDGLSHKTLS